MDLEITIIIPTFRPNAYLWDCLTSIDGQTLNHERFEVLLVLNGERQPYEREIISFLSAHSSLPCRLIYNEETGVSAARNRGLDEARGEYICFIDDDDLITENYLEKLYALVSKDTIPLSYIRVFDDGTQDYRTFYITENFQEDDRPLPYTVARRYFYVPYAKMIHCDIIGNRRFDKTLKNGEDALFMLLVSDRIKWVRFTDKSAEYRYRQRPTSAFNARRPASYHIANMLRCQGKAIRFFFSRPIDYSVVFYVKYLLATTMGCLRRIRNVKQ